MQTATKRKNLMTIVTNTGDSGFEQTFNKLLTKKRSQNKNIVTTVSRILESVRRDGDQALIKLTEIHDNIRLSDASLRFSNEEIKSQIALVSPSQKKALKLAADRIISYHTKQLPQDAFWTDETGAGLGWVWRPITKVGLYVPGGTASYPSSVLMSAIPAVAAGVKELILVTPTPSGKVNPLVLLAANMVGINKIFKIGGAQAIAALAFGTSSVPVVDKIAGPGNSFVTEAKRQVFGKTGIDMIAGPSEVLIIADEKNRSDWIAIDLMSQAEHDENSRAVLLTTSTELAKAVKGEVEKILGKLERRDIAQKSWHNFGAIIVVKSLDEACLLSNKIAPEHLQLFVQNPMSILKKITNAGSVFLGAFSPEAIGDYIGGTNHILPTAGASRFSSGLSVTDFMKRISVSQITEESFKKIGREAAIIASSEGLQAHELSLKMRLNKKKSK